MASKFQALKKELASLLRQGEMLYYSMLVDTGSLTDEMKEELEKLEPKLPRFELEYDTWYSEALRVVKQIIPDRTDDFVKQYKNEKRKEIDFLT